jgi:rRNA-processing protein FCF1
MLVTPRPGTNRESLLNDLRTIKNETQSLCGGTSAYTRLLDYLDWVGRTVRALGNQISIADLDRLVLTKRYEQLLAGVGTMTGTEIEVRRVVNGLVSLELAQRIEAFDQAVKALDAQIKRWSNPWNLVVLDTSFYIQHEQKLGDADIAPLVIAPQSDVHVIVPIVVVDELDGLKQSKDSRVRGRARYTLAVLDRVFAVSTTGPAQLRTGDVLIPGPDGTGRGQITMELLFDPPGHVRLPIYDDEIVDRALAVVPLAAGHVTLLTYDTGQAMRARAAGLQVKKLREEPEQQDAAPPKKPTKARPKTTSPSATVVGN